MLLQKNQNKESFKAECINFQIDVKIVLRYAASWQLLQSKNMPPKKKMDS